MAFDSYDDPMLTKKSKSKPVSGNVEIGKAMLNTPKEVKATSEQIMKKPGNIKFEKSNLAATSDVEGPKPRGKRKVNKPLRYLTYVPPTENKPRSEKCDAIKLRRNVWILHPEFPNETIAIGKAGPHWRTAKKTWIPNVSNVSWEPGMQQVTVDHVYPQYMNVEVLHPNSQREGIITIFDALDGAFAEDATIVWKTRFLKCVET
ncbi:hypothetical protein M758_UG181600 [Ceratodon purpureus]|nr:hypothetical protein M758_UG181600 [Ceratodon purpureus]